MAKTIWIHGISGKMGQEVHSLIKTQKLLNCLGGSSVDSTEEEIETGLSSSQLIIDFSSSHGNEKLLSHANRLQNKSILICTTGLSDESIEQWKTLGAHNRVMLAANTSLGVLVFGKILSEYGQLLFHSDFDIELVETHHRHKIDAPSGTLKFLRNAVDPQNNLTERHQYKDSRKKREIGIHSIRGGGVAGEHTVRFIADHEEISITHRAFQRSLFASGALVLMKLLDQKTNGYYEYGSITTEELLKVMKE